MIIRLADLSTIQAAEALATARVALLPLGAIEQHGPHLALRADISIAESLAERLSDSLGNEAVLLPAVPYGLSEHHLDFAGTITLRPETFIGVILDVADSLAAHGIRKIIIVNGHGGNIDAIRLAARKARRDRGIHIAQIMWAIAASDMISSEMQGRGPYNHGCEVETSLALELRPDLITGDLPHSHSPVELARHLAPPTNFVDAPVWFAELSPDSGYLGDPSRATKERGARLAEVVISRAEEFARDFIEDAYPLRA